MNSVRQGVKALGEKLSWARDARLGHLAFCPTNLGTSLRASVLLNVPTLAGQPNFQATLDKLHLQCRGRCRPGYTHTHTHTVMAGQSLSPLVSQSVGQSVSPLIKQATLDKLHLQCRGRRRPGYNIHTHTQ